MMQKSRSQRVWGAIGALLIAAGLCILAVSVYQLTIGEQQASEQQETRAEEVPLVLIGDGSASEAPGGSNALAEGEFFAKLYAPRFGAEYVRNIAEGTSLEKVLNTVGLGHYSSTQMPGEVGNFAIAGHRAGNGGPLREIDKFVSGDLVYVETSSTWFTYKFLESKVVEPNAIGVIDAVPQGLTQQGGTSSNGKFLTLTSCTPIYVNTQRIIAWFELVAEQPTSSGVPSGLPQG
jgi:sortase A